MTSSSVAPVTPSEQIADLSARFASELAEIVEQPFWALLDEYVAGLTAVVSECDVAARSLFDEISDLASRASFEQEAGRHEFLQAAEALRSEHAERVLALFRSEAFRATDWRAENTFDALLRAADAVGDGYPDVIRIPQEEARFRPLPSDPLHLRAGKTIKRTLRPVRKEWSRAVPVAAAARFHASGRFPERVVPVYSGVRRLRAAALASVHRLYRITLEGMRTIRAKVLQGSSAAEIGAHALDVRARIGETASDDVAGLRHAADQVVSILDAAVREVAASFDRTLAAAGTIERPAASISSVRQWKALTQALEAQRELSARWDAYEAGLRESLEAQAEFVRLGAFLGEAAARALTGIHESIQHRLYGPIESLRTRLAEAAIECDALCTGGGDLAAELPRLHGEIEKAFIAQSTLLGEHDPAWSEVRGYLEALVGELKELPAMVEEHRELFSGPGAEIPADPADLARRKAPLRKLAQTYCAGRLPRQLALRVRSVEQEFHGMRADVQRLQRAIAFNVAAALQGLQVPKGEASASAADLVVGVLRRGEHQLSELLETCRAIDESLAHDLRQRLVDAADKMIGVVADGDILAIRADILDEETARGAASAMTAARRAGASVRSAAGRMRTGWGRLRGAHSWMKQKMGLATIEKAEMLTSLDQSVFDEGSTAALPRIYRQLFAPVPLEWDQFLAARDRELETIATAFGRWRDGHASSVVVFGEKGSGKTTLLGSARRRIFESVPVRSISLERTVESEEELLEILGSTLGITDAGSLDALATRVAHQERGTILLEGAHHLFLRTVGGFEVLRRFLAFLSATKRAVFWIVTLDQYAWAYLSRVFGIQEHFEFAIDATNLPAQEIETAILARHDASGYAIRFEVDDRTRASRHFRRLARKHGVQAAARKVFFEELAKIAEGNIFLALFYWLRSIAAVEEHTVVFRMPRVIPVGFLETLPLATLHTIAAVIQHGGLTANAHAAVFQLTPEESRLRLSAMADSHLLLLGEDGQYKANRILYRPFVRLLKARNIF